MSEPAALPAPQAEALLAVEGMHCAACVQLIDLRVGALRGVTAVEASLATHRVRVPVYYDSVSLFVFLLLGARQPLRVRQDRHPHHWAHAGCRYSGAG